MMKLIIILAGLVCLARAEFSSDYPEDLPPKMTIIEAISASDVIVDSIFKNSKFGIVRAFCMRYPKPQKGFENKWSVVYLNDKNTEVVVTVTYPELHGFLWSAESDIYPDGISKRFLIEKKGAKFTILEQK